MRVSFFGSQRSLLGLFSRRKWVSFGSLFQTLRSLQELVAVALAGQEDLQEPQNPTGLQELAGGVAGIEGLPSGGQEE